VALTFDDGPHPQGHPGRAGAAARAEPRRPSSSPASRSKRPGRVAEIVAAGTGRAALPPPPQSAAPRRQVAARRTPGARGGDRGSRRPGDRRLRRPTGSQRHRPAAIRARGCGRCSGRSGAGTGRRGQRQLDHASAAADVRAGTPALHAPTTTARADSGAHRAARADPRGARARGASRLLRR